MWHQATKPWRERGDLVVVGIVQEQHPERAQLFAQWHGIDWPILWDPLNLTNSKAVPNKVAVDEHGIVRSKRPNRHSFVKDFLGLDFPAPEGVTEPTRPEGDEPHELLQFSRTSPKHPEHEIWHAYGQALWGDFAALEQAIATMRTFSETRPDDARTAFRYGVLLRLRHDRNHRGRPQDFVTAVSLWDYALFLDPAQYIWRRRIQQFGPLLDKPYPFYPWIDEATLAVRERNEEPVPIEEYLGGAEVLGPKGTSVRLTDFDDAEPPGDRPKGPNLIRADWAVVPDTSKGSGAVRVYLGVRPVLPTLHWDHDPGPARFVIRVPGELERWVGAETHGGHTERLDAWIDFELDGADAERTLEGMVTVHVQANNGRWKRTLSEPFEVTIPAREPK